MIHLFELTPSLNFHTFWVRPKLPKQPAARVAVEVAAGWVGDGIGVGANMAGNHEPLVSGKDRKYGFPLNSHENIVV